MFLNPFKMKPIYIFGTGGFAKEVYFLIKEINEKSKLYEIAGFIDIEPTISELTIDSQIFSVITEEYFFASSKTQNVCFAIGIGNPKTIKSIQEKYSTYDFPNLIHPNVIGLFSTISMGFGNIITAGCIFTVDISIGSFNVFNLNSTIGHDTIIGNCNVINPGVNISGGVYIGDNNLFGTNSAILQYLKIGQNNVIGAGAMVNSCIENNKISVGVPAKIIKENN